METRWLRVSRTVKPGTPVECGGPQATDAMRALAEGQPVNLVSDPTQDAVDQFGRSLFYVDRIADGLDVGEEMLRNGWANVFVFDQDFQRLSRYRAARSEARDSDAGVWSRCDGDFHRTRVDELRERRLAAVTFMRRYYRRVSNPQFATAWTMLARPLRRKLGPFSDWKAGYRRTVGVSVLSASTPVRTASGGLGSTEGARSRRLQWTSRAAELPRPLDPRASAGLVGSGPGASAENERRACSPLQVRVPTASTPAEPSDQLPGVQPVPCAGSGCRLRWRLRRRTTVRRGSGVRERQRSL
jgi:hypothetical protein